MQELTRPGTAESAAERSATTPPSKPKARPLKKIGFGGVQYADQDGVLTTAEVRPASDTGRGVALVRVVSAPVKSWGFMRFLGRVAPGLFKERVTELNRASLPPIPPSVHLSIPGITECWREFLRLYAGSHATGHGGARLLAWEEIGQLATWAAGNAGATIGGRQRGGNSFSARKIRQEFEAVVLYDSEVNHSIDKSEPGATFEEFSLWLEHSQTLNRRAVRREVKENFELFDRDHSGILDYGEFTQVVHKTQKFMNVEVDLDADWAAISKVPIGEANEVGEFEEGVTFNDFERWWKERAGVREPDIPVLPEFMVLRISDQTRSNGGWSGVAPGKTAGVKKTSSASPSRASRSAEDYVAEPSKGTRTNPHGPWTRDSPPSQEWLDWYKDHHRDPFELWRNLGASLHTMVDMRRQWGDLHEMYETRAESLYEVLPFPQWVRDPDSNFSAAWDVATIFLLFFVAMVAPIRAAFDLETECLGVAFWIDVLIDLFFITDVVLNFRTAYYTRSGVREERPGKMALHYLKGWFFIDFISCLPVQYVACMVQDSEEGGEAGAQVRVLKILRLARLSKMLRLARIKRIVSKWGKHVSLQQYTQVGGTCFAIVLMAHMLACVFYVMGKQTETLAETNHTNLGWVYVEDGWCAPADGHEHPGGNAGHQGCDVDYGVDSAFVEYFTSLYYVLNALEAPGTTTYERIFGIIAELMRDIILGLVASLITTISLSSGSMDAESATRMRGLKLWMNSKHLPKSFQAKTMEYFNELVRACPSFSPQFVLSLCSVCASEYCMTGADASPPPIAQWSSSSVELDQLLKQMPPAMRSTVTEFMYKRFLASMPLFRALSDEVVSSLCHRVRPLMALKGQEIMREGAVGREMYMVMEGEVEVIKDNGPGMAPLRLGFLSEGAFFGEVPVLESTPGSEIRTRTVRSVTDKTELCYITKDDMDELQERYPELKARIRRFVRTGAHRGKKINSKTLKKLDLTREQMGSLVHTFSTIQNLSSEIRQSRNWADGKAVPWKMLVATLGKSGSHGTVSREGNASGPAQEQTPVKQLRRTKTNLDVGSRLSAFMSDDQKYSSPGPPQEQQHNVIEERMGRMERSLSGVSGDLTKILKALHTMKGT